MPRTNKTLKKVSGLWMRWDTMGKNESDTWHIVLKEPPEMSQEFWALRPWIYLKGESGPWGPVPILRPESWRRHYWPGPFPFEGIGRWAGGRHHRLSCPSGVRRGPQERGGTSWALMLKFSAPAVPCSLGHAAKLFSIPKWICLIKL